MKSLSSFLVNMISIHVVSGLDTNQNAHFFKKNPFFLHASALGVQYYAWYSTPVNVCGSLL